MRGLGRSATVTGIKKYLPHKDYTAVYHEDYQRWSWYRYGRGILMISEMVEMVATVMPLDHLLVWRLTVMIISKNLKNI